ncbi:MAG TPA: hypothetical protein VM934_11905 [Pyrinomonadaceae bacterium]|nr:hypothetical protein [Pyrinomonadaceae bacterium]
MKSSEESVRELIGEANGLEHGDTRIMLLEEAVRLSDTVGFTDESLRLKAREDFVEAATFGGAPDKAIVAFSWCLAQLDKKAVDDSTVATRFSRWETLWKYKWIVANVCGFPQISRARIYEMLEDMERRYREEFDSLRPVYSQRWRIEHFWDNRPEADKYFRKWQLARRDVLSDCAACEANDEVNYYDYCGQYEQALRAAAPILGGRLRCTHIPHRTYANILLPLVRLGRADEATAYHLKGYPLISRNKNFLSDTGDHLRFLVLTANLDKAVALFEAHFPWALAAVSLSERFSFYLDSWLLFTQLREGGRDTVTLRLPETFEGHVADGKYETRKLEAWLDENLRGLARRFDARNQNDYFTRRIADTAALKNLVTPYPFKEHRGAGESSEA